jgi:hypothetical protein
VLLTSPASGATYTAPATVQLAATALDSDGSISRVDFLVGGRLIGSDTTSPYAVSWSVSSAGSYAVTAAAQDNDGAWTSSAPLSVTVVESTPTNKPPAVSLTAPANGATFTAPATITLSATASDPDGSIAGVDFYAGTALIASDSTSPYTRSWNVSSAGSYTITAAAKDNDGGWTSSAPVSITVKASANQPPAVSLTAPANGATFAALATINLSASASDPDGSVARVDFYAGTALVGSDSSSPYSVSWSSVPAGTYSLTALARDNVGATKRSTAVSISVAAAISLPRYVVFNASTDHSTVTAYTVEFFAAGANPSTATPVRTQNVGKPTPVNGEITVDVASTIQALPSGTYVSTVRATGTGGSSRSAPSESFVR